MSFRGSAVIDADRVINAPAGGITATNVQDAINELDTEKVSQGALLINVKDYPTPQDAIDASAFGALIYFPNSTYTVSQILKLKAGRHYFGGNRESVVIKMANGANLDAVAASEAWLSTTATTSDNPVSVEHMTFDANKANQTVGLGHGLVLMSFWNNLNTLQGRNTRGDGLLLTSKRQDGVEISGGVESHVFRFDSRNSDSYGIRVEASVTNQETDGWLKDCIVQNAAEDGIRIDTATGWEVSGNHLYGIGKNGINLGRADSSRVHDNYIEPWGTSATPGAYAAIALGDGSATFIGSSNPSTVVGNTAYMGGFAVGTTLFGIRTVTSSGATAHLAITGNALLGTGFHTGISIGHQSGTSTTFLTLSGNHVYGFATPYSLTGTGTLTILGGDTFKALAPSATAGFDTFAPVTGIPTGVPADLTRGLPAVVDTANNRIWVYTAGAWVPMGMSAVPPMRVASGEYLVTPHTSTATVVMSTLNTMYLMAVDIEVATTFAAIATSLAVVSSGGTGHAVRLGYYADDGTRSRPAGPCLNDAGTFDPTATTGDRVLALAGGNQTLQPRRIWLAVAFQGSVVGTGPTLVSLAMINQTGGLASLGNNSHRTWAQSGVTGALPAIGTLFRAGNNPIIGLKVA